MKNKVSYILLSSVLIFSACGNKDEKSSDGKKKGESSEETVEAEGPKRLSVKDIDLSKPIPCEVANAEIMCWEEKIVDVAGPVYVYYGDSAAVDYGSFTMISEIGKGRKTANVYLKDKEKKFKISKNDFIHLRGKVGGLYFDSLVSFTDAEIIETAPSFKTEKLDPTKEGAIFNITELQDDILQWGNVEIAVVGNYFMTTTSKTSYGTTIRVDLKGPKSDYADVGCEFSEDPSDKLKDNREGVIIIGKVKPGGSFGKLQLTDCRLVNR